MVRNVPAWVCGNRGEAYLSEEVSSELLEWAGQKSQGGVLVDIREFRPAA